MEYLQIILEHSCDAIRGASACLDCSEISNLTVYIALLPHTRPVEDTHRSSESVYLTKHECDRVGVDRGLVCRNMGLNHRSARI